MISTIILAGGESKRFGSDKKFYKIFGKTFLEHIYNAVKQFSNEIIVSISSYKDYERIKKLFPDVTVIIDKYDIRSPINGLKSSINHCKYDIVAITPCDTPFISPSVYKFMIEKLNEYSATIPIGDRIYILNSVFKKEPLKNALKSLDVKDSVRKILRYINNVLFIDVNILKSLDKHLLTFLNINSKDDLEKIYSNIKFLNINYV